MRIQTFIAEVFTAFIGLAILIALADSISNQAPWIKPVVISAFVVIIASVIGYIYALIKD